MNKEKVKLDEEMTKINRYLTFKEVDENLR
jgi:hypothetical protein